MSTEAARQRILIVDDEPTNIQTLGNLLKDDYRLMVANGGTKALKLLTDNQSVPPDLILLDIQMSDLDGHEVCRRLRANPLTSKIPIIFVTARSRASDEEYGLNLGAVDYITKPFSAAIVRARVATHLRLKRQIDLLEQYALLDGLTAIPNRRHLDELLTQEIRRCLRDQVPLSVIMIDIDDFKRFNDRYGHGAGDRCLQKVANALHGSLSRPGDRICRYGGEEFVGLLPDTHGEGARMVAESLRAAVAALSIRHETSRAASVVTISLGIGTLDPGESDHPSGRKLLERADQALFAAKRAGRNRVH